MAFARSSGIAVLRQFGLARVCKAIAPDVARALHSVFRQIGRWWSRTHRERLAFR
jgi:hypothetical protein